MSTHLLNGTLRLGDVDSAESLARKVLADRLHASGAWLNATESEDCLSFLVAEAWELWGRFDPDRTAQSFSTFAYRILWHRVASWYRQRFDDTRYKDVPEFVALEHWDEVVEMFALFEHINVRLLTPDGRNVLERIVMPMVAYDLSAEDIAREFGYSRRWVSRAMARLRDELDYVVAA